LGKPCCRRAFYADKPWWDYHERFAKPLSKIVGALPTEFSNEYLDCKLTFTDGFFYRPTKTSYKIICEEKAFI
jgi:kynureninase